MEEERLQESLVSFHVIGHDCTAHSFLVITADVLEHVFPFKEVYQVPFKKQMLQSEQSVGKKCQN